MPIEDYRDLEVWQRAMQLAQASYEVTRHFPPEERFGLMSQIRRASTSIPANIAEGWGRRYTAEFIQFLRKANGSRTELETHYLLCERIGLLDSRQTSPLLEQIAILGRQLVSLERRLEKKTLD